MLPVCIYVIIITTNQPTNQVGAIVPIVGVQFLHISHSRSTFWENFACADFINWLYVFTFTRYLLEPCVHMVTSGTLSKYINVSEYGVASHLLMTYVHWGFAMLSTDFRWFRRPEARRGTSPATTVFWRAVHAFGIVFLAFNLGMYTWEAYITCRYYHNAADWTLAVLTAIAILALLTASLRRIRNDASSLSRVIVSTMVLETAVVLVLIVYVDVAMLPC